MKGSEYQAAVRRTMGDHLSHEEAMANWCMGLAGESGELIDVVKKHLFHGHELPVEHVRKELGDVLWYVAALATSLELDLDDIMRANDAKLRARYPDGFDPERSQNRNE